MRSHISGRLGLGPAITLDAPYDWDKSTALWRQQEPWWNPGGSGYHGLTYGHLIGEVIRCITGQRRGSSLPREIAGPLVADFHIGANTEDTDRIAELIPAD